MRALCLAGTVLFGLLPAAAHAADRMPPTATPSPNTPDWTGIYVGGQAGFAGGRSSWGANGTGRPEPFQGGAINFYEPFNPWTGTGSYFIGLQGGYNLMLPSRLVLGVETDVIAPSVIGGDERIRTRALGPALYDEEMLVSGTVRGRLGYAFGNWLPYLTGGFAWTFDRVAFNDITETAISSRLLRPATFDHQLLWRLGWTIGAGIEFPFAPNWTLRAEYLFTDFGSQGTTLPAVAQRVDANLNLSGDSVRIELQTANRSRRFEQHHGRQSRASLAGRRDPRTNHVHQPIRSAVSLALSRRQQLGLKLRT